MTPPLPPQDYMKAVLAPGQCANLLLKTLGGRVIRAADGAAEIRIPASPDFCQGGGLVGGGVLATLADEAMAHAVLSQLTEGQSTVTLEMSIRYVRAMRADENAEMIGLARTRKGGRTVHVVECDVTDEQGRLLAAATATFLLTVTK